MTTIMPFHRRLTIPPNSAILESMAYTERDSLLTIEAQYRETLNRLESAEREIQSLNRTIVGMQNELIRAGKYEHEDPEIRLNGIQILLRRAGEYADKRKRGRRG